jgi:hypothetical protein
MRGTLGSNLGDAYTVLALLVRPFLRPAMRVAG